MNAHHESTTSIVKLCIFWPLFQHKMQSSFLFSLRGGGGCRPPHLSGPGGLRDEHKNTWAQVSTLHARGAHASHPHGQLTTFTQSVTHGGLNCPSNFEQKQGVFPGVGIWGMGEVGKGAGMMICLDVESWKQKQGLFPLRASQTHTPRWETSLEVLEATSNTCSDVSVKVFLRMRKHDFSGHRCQ